MSTGNNSRKTYMVGQLPTITALFTNSANTPTNPTTVTFQITNPTGAQVNTASPNAAIVNPTTGTFVFTFTAALAIVGTWIWRVTGVGALTDADEGTFDVLQTLTATP